MARPDTTVFDKQKTLIDQKALQAAFDLKKQMVAAQMQQAQAPSNVQEYQYFQSLPPEQQNQYLNVKRASQVLNLGDQMAIRAPGGGIAETYGVNVNPNNAPELKGLQATAVNNARIAAAAPIAAATTQGKAQGEANALVNNKSRQAGNVIDLIGQAEAILPQATSGYAQNVGSSLKSAFNVSDEKTKADAQLDLLSGALTSNVPRFEGPQGVLDVELYKKMAADVGNKNKPTGDRLAALKTMKTLNQKYASAGQGSMMVEVNPAASQQIIVTNPQTGESLMIDPSDFGAAQAEGFVKQ